MDLFSNLNRKYTIKCYNKSFQANVIDRFDKNSHHNDTIHVGLNTIPEEIKNFKKPLNVVIIGIEIFNEKVLDFFLKKKDNINFYTLSLIDQQYYKEHLQINSKILQFDLPKANVERTKKILYFYKINDSHDLDNNKDFNNYIENSDEVLFSDIKNIKIIFLEPLFSLHNPYLNIAFTNNVPIEYINFYYLSFSDVLNNFKKEYQTFMDKFYSYKGNFIKINNFIHLMTHTKKYILNKVIEESVYKSINNIFNSKEIDPNYFIVFSDNLEYLKGITNNIVLKVYVTSNDQFIIRKLENNFIVINKYFFDEKMQENLKKYHNRKTTELENKYSFYQEAKIYQFLVKKDSEFDFIKNYINLFNKYNITTPIQIYCTNPIKIDNYKGTILYHRISDYKVVDNTMIYYSPEYDIDKHFNQMIMLDNLNVKPIGKLSVMVSSTQYPSYGGAATNTYNIIKYFKKNKEINTVGIFIDSCEDIYEKANPDNVEDVIGLNYRDFNLPDIQSKIVEKFNCYPDIAFCKNCMAPKLIKTVFPNCINIFLVSGIWGFSQLECGANEITDFAPMRKSPEEKSIEMSNLIICNSNLTIQYFKKIYGDIIQNKLLESPVDTTKYNVMHKGKHSKEKRVIDIIAIASNVNRPVKNVKFVKDILTFDKKFKKKKIVIIGENTEELFGDLKETFNIEIISLIKQQEVENYLRKSKIIIIPSLFDSNSNVFREATFNGVIPFISCNVAHPTKYPKFLVLENYDSVEWAYRISHVLDNYHETTQRYSLPKFFSNDDDLLQYVF